MNVLDLIGDLKKTGYPIAYLAFKKPQNPPFICVQEPYTSNSFADGKVSAIIQHVQIDLYTSGKDAEAEDAVQNAISDYAWNKEMEYEDGEDIFRVIYDLEVI